MTENKFPMKTTVTIEWDEPQIKEWLCPDNISIALKANCINTNFRVTESLTQTLVEALEFSKMILGHAIDLGYLNEGSPSFGLANDAIQKTDMALKQFRGATTFVHDVWEFRDENDQ